MPKLTWLGLSAVACVTALDTGCGKSTNAINGVEAASNAAPPIAQGDSPPEGLLEERLIIPNALGYLKPDITVSQVAAFFASRDNTTWKETADGYVLKVHYTDSFANISGDMKLLFGPTRLSTDATKDYAVESDEPFAQILRGIDNGNELNSDDFANIEGKARDAHEPMPAGFVARRQALVPTCESPLAQSGLQTAAANGAKTRAGAPAQFLSITKIAETDFNPMEGIRSCTAVAEFDDAERTATYSVWVTHGLIVGPNDAQFALLPRPATPGGGATDSNVTERSNQAQ